MSYCRWSSDNWKSDVYVYAHCDGGWATHVAGNRIVEDVPAETYPRDSSTAEGDRWMAEHRAAMKFLETVTRVPIALPNAGNSFSDDTPGECADRLEGLRAEGFHVPQHAIDGLREEQAAMDAYVAQGATATPQARTDAASPQASQPTRRPSASTKGVTS